jgi:hypothetical protein
VSYCVASVGNSLWVIVWRLVVIYYRRFGITYRYDLNFSLSRNSLRSNPEEHSSQIHARYIYCFIILETLKNFDVPKFTEHYIPYLYGKYVEIFTETHIGYFYAKPKQKFSEVSTPFPLVFL